MRDISLPMRYGSRVRPAATLALAVLPLSLVAEGSRAEEPPIAARDTLGAVTGRVVDLGSGSGISAAGLTLQPTGRTTSTAPNGAFGFRDVPPGTYELVVEHLAYGADTTAVTVAPGETASVELHLSRHVLPMEPLSVTVRHDYLASVGFYDRMERGWGRFLTPRRLEETGLNNHVRFRPEILLEVMGFPGRSVLETKGCDGPAFYLDGRRRPITGVLSEMSTHEIGAVEVYRYGHGLPLFALDPKAMKCGAVVVWSSRW